MNFEHDPTCSPHRERLAAFAYADLDADAAGALERHLAGCDACAAELDELRRVGVLLSRWDAPAPPTLSIDLLTPAPRRPRIRPLLVGVAAGLAVFLILAFTQTSVAREDGALVVRFGGAGPQPQDVEATSIEQLLLAALEPHLNELRSERDLALVAAERRNEGRLRELQAAVTVALERDRRKVVGLLGALGRERTDEDRRTRKALFELASHIAQAGPIHRDGSR